VTGNLTITPRPDWSAVRRLIDHSHCLAFGDPGSTTEARGLDNHCQNR
jgi:hypothetical protein